MPDFIVEGEGCILVNIIAVPNSKIRRESDRFEISDNRLVVRLEEPPVKGRANKELREILSKMLGVPRRNIEIVKGELSREKLIRIEGVTKEQFLEKLKLWTK